MPILGDFGHPAHLPLIVFWLSQTSNVTPPISLATFAAAGVAGANHMATAAVSFKLAGGFLLFR